MRRGARSRARDARKAVQAAGEVIFQSPGRSLDNPYSPLAPLTDEQLELIHDASMAVLEDLGIEVASRPVRERFRASGAIVDDASNLVRVERQLVNALVSQAPECFSLTPRNRSNRIKVGGNRINFGLVSGPPNVHDRVNGRRPGNFEDYQKLIKLGQVFNVINFFGNQVIAPIDLPTDTRHLDTYRANLFLSDKVYSAMPIGRERVQDAVEMTAMAVDSNRRSSDLINTEIDH